MAQPKFMNTLEQHAEKIALAVCALLLAYGLFKWGLSSPAEIEGRGPDEVDAYLVQKAQTLDRRVKDLPVQDGESVDYVAVVEGLRTVNHFANSQMADLGAPRLALRPGVDIGQANQLEYAVIAAQAPAPEAPLAVARLHLPRIGEEPVDSRAAHVLSVYPWGDLSAKWRAQLSQAGIDPTPVVLDVLVEVEELLPDGSWGRRRLVSNQAGALGETVRAQMETMRQALGGARVEDVRGAVQSLRQDQWQQVVLMMPYPEVWDSSSKSWTDWKLNWAEATLEEFSTRLGTAVPTTPAATTPAVRPGAFDGAPPMMRPPTTVGPPPTMRPPTTVGPPPTMRPPTTVSPPPTMRPPTTSGFDGAPMMRQPGSSGETLPAPPLRDQQAGGLVLAWRHVHDLQPRQTYRYRISLVLVNPLLTHEDKVKDVEDARRTAINTPWSEWSKPVRLPRATEFRLVGGNRHAGEVRVRVSTQVLGEPVTSFFWIKAGEPIGRTASVQVTHPATGHQQSQQVDFSTDCVMVHADFDRNIPVGDRLQQTVELLYLDEEGRLATRTRLQDEAAPN